jgi:hypothetical protein
VSLKESCPVRKIQLHFCSDQTAWRFIIPALLDLPIFQFDWESCQTPQDYVPATTLLKSSFFCPTTRNAVGAIDNWFDLYGLDGLISKIDLMSWGEIELNIPCRPLTSLSSVINGYVLDIQSRHPEQSIRSLLKSRGLLHPVERENLRNLLNDCAQQLQLDISPLPTPPAFGFDWQGTL